MRKKVAVRTEEQRKRKKIEIKKKLKVKKVKKNGGREKTRKRPQ